MKITTKIAMIAAFLMIAVLAGPALAADACIVPPPEYFTTDGYGASPAPVHEGLQLGYVWWITAEQRIEGFSGNHYLGFDRGSYALKISHNEQERVRFGQMFYCYSLPDYPYKPAITGVSEDPSTSIYEPAHSSAVFR